MSELLKWERATESLLLPLVVSLRNTVPGLQLQQPSLWACPARIPEPAKGRWEPVLQQGKAGPQQPQPALYRLSINSTTKDPLIAFFTCTSHFNGVEIEFQLDNA